MTVIEAWIGGEVYEKVEGKPDNLQVDIYDILCDAVAINSKANVNVNTDGSVPEYIGNKTECAMLLMLHKFGVNYKTIRKGSAPGVVQM
jgi:Ca2+-transporting ATPase